jgi:FAD/FMN-containing dehydrogenase/Fe-S oxidoreductase
MAMPHTEPVRAEAREPSPPRTFVPAEIEREIRGAVRGEVRFDAGGRALYATDASNYRQVPIGVVVPRDVDDVVAAVAACRRTGAPVLSRGGGTSLAGQCCNVAVVLDFTRHVNRLISLDPAARRAVVEPGIVLDVLRNEAEKHHLTFGPDPATHNHCTLGGMIGNNSCGVHAQMAGRTADNVEELEVLTYDGLRLRVGPTSEDELARIIAEGGPRGRIYARLRSLRDRYADLVRARFPDIPRRISGYNLDELLPEKGFNVARALVGTESTCVTVLSATLRLVHSPPSRKLVVLGYPDIYRAADHLPDILRYQPLALEGLDDILVAHMKKKRMHPGTARKLPEGKGWLMVEVGGDTEAEAHERAEGIRRDLARAPNAPKACLFDTPEEQHQIWEIRESGLGATAFVPGERDAWPGWEDSAVPPDRMGDYLRDFRRLLDRHGLECALYGHFGQGCLHCRISFDMTSRAGIANFRSFVEKAADLVVSYGGSLSGEHGDGQARAELLPKMYGPELVRAFREFKRIWDPEGMMNPGKVVDPYRLDENLRLGVHYDPPEVETHFRYPDDQGSFARAALRCVGIGKCRREHGGAMCPSFRATHDEMHVTRGRARILFEMLQGEEIEDGFRDDHVMEALDLCLACKACKHECPVNVDMATYKAEFLAHHYEGRLRPRSAYSMGLIDVWARIAARVPRLANLILTTPGLSRLAKWAGGITPERPAPRFATQTFQRWFHARPARPAQGRPVILWPDTFNNHFHPEVAKAAVSVLEAAGYDVRVPEGYVCCGRPLYDFGWLGRARRLLERTLDQFAADIDAGVPIVGLEPSCVAVFRDELVQFMPQEERAKRLHDQTFTLGEFLLREGWSPPALDGKAVIHGHCHHRSVLDFQSDVELLKKTGLDAEVLDSGCCGMAGSFGFERGKYDVSMAIGEHELLPKVREAPEGTLVITDGFSCRTQIEQGADRRPLHIAEVLAMALGEQPSERPSAARRKAALGVAAAAGLAVAAVAGIAWARRR